MSIRLFTKVTIQMGMAIALTSCSIFPGDTSRSFDVFAESSGRPQALSADFEKLQADPVVYKTHLSQTKEVVFMAPIEDCGISDTHVLKPSLTRQLFVGMSELQVEQRENLEIDGKPILHWKAKGVLDGTPLAFSSYSFIAEGCLRDIVLWSTNVPHTDEFTLFAETFRNHMPVIAWDSAVRSRQ